MGKVVYICTSEEKPIHNVKGKHIGNEPKRALFYSKHVGKGRFYRGYFPHPGDHSLKLFELDSYEDARKMCEQVNNHYKDNFKPEAKIVS